MYYRLDFDDKTKFPRVFESIRIDTDLHVQLQYNGIKVPLPDWFVIGKNAKLSRVSMIANFPPHLKQITDDKSNKDGLMSIMEELEQQNFYKPNGRPPYSAAMIRYALLLRYTSALLQQEGVDSIRALKKMRDKGKIFEDLVLMADEMFLQIQ